MTVTCEYCGGDVDSSVAYQKVTGWERKRGQGGTNALRCRKPHGVFACPPCVGSDTRGTLNQEVFPLWT